MAASRVKGYELIAQIASGAKSHIWRARQLSTGDAYAVKIVQRGHGVDERYFRQMENEYRIARRFNHPNLARVYEFIPSGFLFWTFQVAVVVELVPGPNLAELAVSQPLPLPRLIDLYIQLADGLGYMHSQGFVHLDMKPHNVVVTSDDKAKIVDFGLCMPTGQYNPRIQGTPAFMAPEQIVKGRVDERTDIYNLGATMFYILTGKSAQIMLTQRNGNGKSGVADQAFRSLSVDIPEELEALIMTSCRPNPADRPWTMNDVATRLRDVAQQMSKTTPDARPVAD